MPLLFCNVGWMNKYNGIDSDSIERGGKYNEHSIGHEVCNFNDNAGVIYGYVQSTGNINLTKIGGSKTDEFASGVTVVWTAGPPSGGTAVVGWYKDATVYRELQTIPKPTAIQKKNGIQTYRIKVASKNAVLLPVTKRELMIPRGVKGGIGQSNVWFAAQEESKNIVSIVLKLVHDGSTPSLPDLDTSKSILEGNPRLVAHLRRERSALLVKAKKESILAATGKPCCEVCNFDFNAAYKNFGTGFCEVHHLQPLSKADGVVKTELKDLAIICSNCHRIIHRTDPMLSTSEFKAEVWRKEASEETPR